VSQKADLRLGLHSTDSDIVVYQAYWWTDGKDAVKMGMNTMKQW